MYRSLLAILSCQTWHVGEAAGTWGRSSVCPKLRSFCLHVVVAYRGKGPDAYVFKKLLVSKDPFCLGPPPNAFRFECGKSLQILSDNLLVDGGRTMGCRRCCQPILQGFRV